MYKQVSICASLLVVVAIIFFTIPRPQSTLTSTLPTTTVTIGSTKIEVEIASTPAQYKLGLSGRESLVEGQGMLFVFTQPNRDGFWMKDMHFSLDILWADSNGKIITIAHDISPSTFPQ